MKTYRYVGESRAFVPDLGREVDPGETVRTEVEIRSVLFEPVAETQTRKKLED